jgi:hypothetical protein
VIPPYGRRHLLADDAERTHPFRFHRAARRPLALLGVRPANAHVFVDAHVLHVSFGPWAVITPVANVIDAEPVGTLPLWRSLGVRCSPVDRALTFGSDRTGAVRLRFHDLVHRFGSRATPGHPRLTVTLEDRERLLRQLRERPAVIPPISR